MKQMEMMMGKGVLDLVGVRGEKRFGSEWCMW